MAFYWWFIVDGRALPDPVVLYDSYAGQVRFTEPGHYAE